MKKKILGSIVLIAACWFVAFIIIEVNRELEWLGLAIFIGGIAYSGFNITKSLIQGVRESVFYNDKKRELAKQKAEQEILRCKNLLDVGALTQDEYDKKAKELKVIILQE